MSDDLMQFSKLMIKVELTDKTTQQGFGVLHFESEAQNNMVILCLDRNIPICLKLV
jgi:hypothetical protein